MGQIAAFARMTFAAAIIGNYKNRAPKNNKNSHKAATKNPHSPKQTELLLVIATPCREFTQPYNSQIFKTHI